MYISATIPSFSSLGAFVAPESFNNGLASEVHRITRTATSSIEQPILQQSSSTKAILSPIISMSTNTNGILGSSTPSPQIPFPKYIAYTSLPATARIPATPSRSVASSPKKTNAWEGLIPGSVFEAASINPSDLSTLVPISMAQPIAKSPAVTPSVAKTTDWGLSWEQLGTALPPSLLSSFSSLIPLNVPRPTKPSVTTTRSMQAVVPSLTSQPAKPQPRPSPTEKLLPRLLFKFGNGTWVEHIAVGPGSSLFLTLHGRPELYRFDPMAPHKEPVLVRRFAEEGRLSGISEIAPNEYAVLVSRKGMSKGRDVTEIWVVRCDDECNGKLQYSRNTGKLNVEWLGGPYTGLDLNGMTTAGPSMVLASDGLNGKIYGFSIPGTTATTVLSDARMLGPGIGGIRLIGNMLYFTNTQSGIFARTQVDISRASAPMYNRHATTAPGSAALNIASSPVEVIAKGLVGVKEFAISSDGEAAYLADSGRSALLKVNLRTGTASKFAHIPGGPTSARFGRRLDDQDVLYVATSSGALFAVKL